MITIITTITIIITTITIIITTITMMMMMIIFFFSTYSLEVYPLKPTMKTSSQTQTAAFSNNRRHNSIVYFHSLVLLFAQHSNSE
jgi:flagellar basal body-associated protein FliL